MCTLEALSSLSAANLDHKDLGSGHIALNELLKYCNIMGRSVRHHSSLCDL